MSSTTEGFFLPAMEAMACRTPVVCTPTGWPAEAIRDGVNGRLVPFDNPGALASAAEWVLRLDESAWRRLSDAAYATVKDATWSRSSALFEAALNGRPFSGHA